MYHNFIRNEFNEITQTLNAFLSDERQIQFIEDAADLISTTFKAGGKVLSCGNGGSHCNAMHFAEELTCRYRENRPGYPAIAISDPSYLSCVGNDFGYEQIFSRYIDAVGNKGDVLVSISTSGNSVNILNAIETARTKDIKIIVLTGNHGRKITGSVDVEICVPYLGHADRIQEVHIKWKGIIAVSRGGLVPSALLARELGIRYVDTVCISSYDHDNQRELRVLKREKGDGQGFIVVDDLVDTGGTAKAIREMYPKARFVTIFAKPAGRPLVDDYVIDISQDTWIEQPWDMGVIFVPPLVSK